MSLKIFDMSVITDCNKKKLKRHHPQTIPDTNALGEDIPVSSFWGIASDECTRSISKSSFGEGQQSTFGYKNPHRIIIFSMAASHEIGQFWPNFKSDSIWGN